MVLKVVHHLCVIAESFTTDTTFVFALCQIYSANGSNSFSNIRSKLQIESIGSTSLSSGDDSFSIVKEKTVSLDDIPFQCGMCLSRFPTSQYLLHHITLHMQGPYVFKIEMDKKEKEDEENGEKILPHGNISFAGRSRLLPTSIPKTVNFLKSAGIFNVSGLSLDVVEDLTI
jgi:hypothetical protein